MQEGYCCSRAMNATFVTPGSPLGSVEYVHRGKNGLCPRVRGFQLSRSVRRTATLRMVASQGWAETRLTLPSLEPIKSEPPLPGIHYAEPPRMTADDLLKIIRAETPDEWVNEIVRTFLGWRQLENGEWNDDLVEPRWKKVYKTGPPDFIGKVGEYTPDKDMPVKVAVQNLSRSVPAKGKQLLKPTLKPFGFSGWKVDQLTPNLTRRAQAVNFILHWYKAHYPDYVWS